MMSITQIVRQQLPRNLKAASNFSKVSVKNPATAKIHTVKLLELHDTLHRVEEPDLQSRLRGLQMPQFPNSTMSSQSTRVTSQSQSTKKAETPKILRSTQRPKLSLMAGAANQTFSVMISSSAQAQINKIRESHGRFQDKYLYGGSKDSPKSSGSQDRTASSEPRSASGSAGASESKNGTASSFANKVKKAQRELSLEDLANAYDL